jgi:hypothetical protein
MSEIKETKARFTPSRDQPTRYFFSTGAVPRKLGANIAISLYLLPLTFLPPAYPIVTFQSILIIQMPTETCR